MRKKKVPSVNEKLSVEISYGKPLRNIYFIFFNIGKFLLKLNSYFHVLRAYLPLFLLLSLFSSKCCSLVMKNKDDVVT